MKLRYVIFWQVLHINVRIIYNAKKNISLIVVSKAASDTIKKKARILLEHVIEEEQNKTVD